MFCSNPFLNPGQTLLKQHIVQCFSFFKRKKGKIKETQLLRIFKKGPSSVFHQFHNK